MSAVSAASQITRHLYFYGPLEGPDKIQEIIKEMDLEWNLPEESVILHLNTPGGDTSSLVALLYRLGQVKNLMAIAEGDVISAGLFLYLSASTRAAIPYATFLAHGFQLYTGESSEPMSNMRGYADVMQNTSEEMLKKYFKKYLKKSDLDLLMRGGEICFSVEEAVNVGIVNSDM